MEGRRGEGHVYEEEEEDEDENRNQLTMQFVEYCAHLFVHVLFDANH